MGLCPLILMAEAKASVTFTNPNAQVKIVTSEVIHQFTTWHSWLVVLRVQHKKSGQWHFRKNCTLDTFKSPLTRRKKKLSIKHCFIACWAPENFRKTSKRLNFLFKFAYTQREKTEKESSGGGESEGKCQDAHSKPGPSNKTETVSLGLMDSTRGLGGDKSPQINHPDHSVSSCKLFLKIKTLFFREVLPSHQNLGET